jgi:hypothetical protein
VTDTDIGRDVPARAIVRFQSAADLTAHMILGTLSATLNAPVKETFMMSPKGISEKRSISEYVHSQLRVL